MSARRGPNNAGARTVEYLRELVAFDTTSANSNLDLVDWVVEHLESCGARVRLTHGEAGAKANVLASFGPEAPGGVLLSSHTDVVPVGGQRWSSDPFTLVERGGRLHGRGTADMKGFIAACLAVCSDWRNALLSRPIHLALTHDEETGGLGVPNLVADLVSHVPLPALAIVGEPTGMQVADRHRGYLGFRTTCRGRSVHSSDPGKGVSAIAAAARFVTQLECRGGRRTDEEEPTTLNVGQIRGGTNLNVVPGHCEVVWEMRPAPGADLDALRATANQVADVIAQPGLTVDTQEIITVPPLRPQRSNAAVRVACELGAARRTTAVPYGSEAGFFQAAGIPTALCGPGSIGQAHQADEWIAVEQLESAIQFLSRLTSWAARP